MNEEIKEVNEVAEKMQEMMPEVMPMAQKAAEAVAKTKKVNMQKIATAGVLGFAAIGVVASFKFLKNKGTKIFGKVKAKKAEPDNIEEYVTTDDVEIEEAK